MQDVVVLRETPKCLMQTLLTGQVRVKIKEYDVYQDGDII